MKKWWHASTVYQIYPKSFYDSNGDGSGDIRGIIEKLDYLKELGIDILWLSPVYMSPMDDNGYDISDYYNILPEFGTMAEMEELIQQAKVRGIKLIMDLVVNHTSDEHPWFIEAKKSKDNPYRDYYVWRDPVNGKEPSDIKSYFSGSVWEYEEATEQYYLHLFSKKQPDLNWDNPKMRADIYKMINFWIEKGVAGFRLDVIDLVGKDIDNKILGNTEKTHEYIHEMNRKTFGKHDLFTVGETGGATIERAKLFTGIDRDELHTVFQFQHIALDEQAGKSKWDLKDLNLVELKEVLSRWQMEDTKEMWNSIYWSNHDQPRILSRWGNDKEYRVQSAKMFALLLHFMKGTPYIYQGEEIGMTNGDFTDISQYRDIETLNLYKERIELGYGHEDIMRSIRVKGRDNARTPIQWNEQENAGFTTGTPWLKVNDNYKEINVEAALKDKDSIFYFYKQLVEFRKNNDIVVYGKYDLISADSEDIFAYTRTYEGKQILVVCNFTDKEVPFVFPTEPSVELIMSNYKWDENKLNKILKPYEAFACWLEA